MHLSQLNSAEFYQEGLQNFQSIVLKIDDKKTYEKAIRQASKKYDIKNFKVCNMTPVKARKIYPSLVQKYSLDSQAGIDKALPNRKHGCKINGDFSFGWCFAICSFHRNPFNSLQLFSLLKTLKDFTLFSSIFNNKKQDFLKFQLFALIKKDKTEAKWSREEDQTLLKVLKYDFLLKNSMDKFSVEEIQWNQASKEFFQLSEHKFYRSSKQCRERWMNHLDPNKIKGTWTVEQDLTLLKFAKEKGKKWSQIVKDLDGCKTQHMVKNRYNSLINKKGKLIGSKNEEKILTRLIEQLQSSQAKIEQEEFKTSSKEALSFISNKSDPIKSEKNDEFPNIFQNDNSSFNSGKKCKFFVQRAGSLSMSQRGGLLPDLANPILEQMDSEEERSRQKFLISTPLSERGGEMKSPFIMNSPLQTGNGGNVTPSLFFLEENVRTGNNNMYGSSEFSLSFSSNFDKFVPE